VTVYPGLYPLDAPTPETPTSGGIGWRSRHGGPGVFVVLDAPAVPPSDHELRVTDFVFEVSLSAAAEPAPPVDPPDGGGDVDAGVNPSPDGSICGEREPVTWCEIDHAGTMLRFAKVAINTGDPKAPEGLTFGQVRRALSGPFADNRGSTMNPTLIDVTGDLRAAEDTDSLIGNRYTQYVSSKRRLAADSDDKTRVFDGVITDTQPGAGRVFSVQVTDYLTLLLDEFNKRTFPQRVYTLDEFPEMGNDPDDPFAPGNPTMLGKPVPIGYGLLSDEQSDTPEGVVPFTFTQLRPFASLGGFRLYEFVAFGHASAGGGQSIFVATGGGLSTGTSYPSRMRVTAATAGTSAPGELALPGSPLWLAEFGTQSYVEHNGNRFYAVYLFGPRAELARTGQVPLVGNIPGIEDVGDGTGNLIDDLYLQILHLLINWIFGDYRSGPWLGPPTVGSGIDLYSRIDTASFQAIKAAMDARIGGVPGAFILGYGEQAQSFGTILETAARNGHFDYGINRHGQLIAELLDPARPITRTITGLADILARSYQVRRRRDLVRNVVPHRSGRRYVASLAGFAPPADSLLPVTNTKPQTDWQHEVLAADAPRDAASVAKYGERIEDISFEMIRDPVTARALAQLVVDEQAIPPVTVGFQEGPCGIDTDLGDVDLVDHFDGLSDEPRPMRCEEHVLDLDTFAVAKTYREV
jgi:hypothetical protein